MSGSPRTRPDLAGSSPGRSERELKLKITHYPIAIAFAIMLSHPMLVVVVLAAGGLIAWGAVKAIGQRSWQSVLKAREEATPAWSARFPEAMPVVDQILAAICEAFLLEPTHQHRLLPEDRVVEIYRQTTGPIADDMQLETMAAQFLTEFGIDVTTMLNESTTLAELVDLVVRRSASAERGR